MGNCHDVYIWDTDVYGKPTDFEDAMDMAVVLVKKCIDTQTASSQTTKTKSNKN